MPNVAENPSERRSWSIYHRDREFAREVGDPQLTIVLASTKEEAEKEASLQGISGPTGIWAHPSPEGALSHDREP